jgi:RHS repeat-associated protein
LIFGFTGKALDEDTGFGNHWNRWFGFDLDQWLNQDPSGFRGNDGNLRRYVANHPTDLVDHNGLEATVIIFVDPTNAPANFDPAAVQQQITLAFSNAGIPITVKLIPSTQPPSKLPLGPNYNKIIHITGTTGHTLWGGPAMWVWSIGNIPWYYLTRTQVYHIHHVRFSTAGFPKIGANAAGQPHCVIYSNSLNNIALWDGGMPKNWDVAYANILIHEVFWHGILDHTLHGIFGFYTQPSDFDNTFQSGSTLVDLAPWKDEIVNELE